MTTPKFGVDDVVDQLLQLPICDLLKLQTTTDLETNLFDQIIQLDNEQLSMDHFLMWMRKLDKWCDNMTNIVHALRSIQMTVTKRRTNTDKSDDHIDG